MGMCLCCFFFLMIRRPPRSTLFPYNDALPISANDSSLRQKFEGLWNKHHSSEIECFECKAHHEVSSAELWRSEEHTSELQSLAYLVCRLLLEKKKLSSSRSATCSMRS